MASSTMISTPATNSWFACLKPNPRATLRLFCFPYAGGGASVFRTWADGFPGSIEVCPIQLPGRETRLREVPFRQLAPLVQAASQAILPYLDKPFALFGHSMGALVSFELAHQLRSEYGLIPVYLFVSGRGGPGPTSRTEPPSHTLPEPEFIEKLRDLKGTPQAVFEHEELMRLMLPILRADFSVCETYAYSGKPPLDCPIIAFGGLQDHDVSRETLATWRHQTSACFSLRMLPGDHFFLHTAQPLLVELISRALHPLASRVIGEVGSW